VAPTAAGSRTGCCVRFSLSSALLGRMGGMRRSGAGRRELVATEVVVTEFVATEILAPGVAVRSRRAGVWFGVGPRSMPASWFMPNDLEVSALMSSSSSDSDSSSCSLGGSSLS
jgi:hypothetical protein